jgi:serine protease Do
MFEQKGKRGSSKIFLASLISSTIVGILVYFFTAGYVSTNRPDTQPPPTNQMLSAVQTTTQDGKTAQTPAPQQLAAELFSGGSVSQAVAKSASPGVVGITVERPEPGKLFNKSGNVEVGVGSGVIVSSNGYILTNNHVAGGKSNRITVSFADGRNEDGTTVWADPVLDLAVVKVNLNDLPALPLGDAGKLEVGEPAIAIGNPLGLEFQRSVTSGIISALNRTIQIDTEQGTNYMEDLIQTDASINPGNSGGPLLNSRGEVVGINTIKVSSAEAMGFAIPINVAKPIVDKLAKTGSFTDAYLGIFAYDKAVKNYIDGNASMDSGVYVAHVDNSGPAYKAGIRVGCIISRIDDMDVSTMMQLRSYLYSKSPGDTINVTHLMHGEDKWVTVPIKLAAKEKDGLITR